MAEILGLGLSHYPPLSSPDAAMSTILRMTLADPGIPSDVKLPVPRDCRQQGLVSF